MAYSPKGVMDIYEILSRWHAGYTISGIAEAFGADRKTIRRYIRAAEGGGLSREEPLPERSELFERILLLVPGKKREMPARSQFDPYISFAVSAKRSRRRPSDTQFQCSRGSPFLPILIGFR